MPRGKSLTEAEIAIIDILYKRGDSFRKIAKEIGRTDFVVRSYIKNPTEYGKKKRSGRKPTVDKRTQHKIFEKATKEFKSSTEIKAELNLNITPERIRQIIKKGFRENVEKATFNTTSLLKHD